MPPPHEITSPLWGRNSAAISHSISLKTSSPGPERTSAGVCPNFSANARSRSTRVRPVALAMFLARSDLPEPGMPMMVIFFMRFSRTLMTFSIASSASEGMLLPGLPRADAPSMSPAKIREDLYACATSIASPPHVLRPSSSASCRNLVLEGL